jgi:hypothetical protein
MEKKLFKNVYYNTLGHAHEVTFSVYRRLNIFRDTNACEMFLSELETARRDQISSTKDSNSTNITTTLTKTHAVTLALKQSIIGEQTAYLVIPRSPYWVTVGVEDWSY